jgi:hypothetical protein
MMMLLGRSGAERPACCFGPKEMTLGDSVNNRQGSFLFCFDI